jgi:hypothetical protein
MSVPTIESTGMGARTTYVYTPEYTQRDFDHMAAILEDSMMDGKYATRIISEDPPRFTISVTETVTA